MKRRGALAAVAIALFAGTVAGCGAHGDQVTPSPTRQPSAVTPSSAIASGTVVATPFPSDPYGSPATPLSPVAGIVTAIEPAGSATPTAFTLKSTSGVTIPFVIGQIDDLADFPLSDLADDIDSQVGILVYFKPQGADLVVYHLETAP